MPFQLPKDNTMIRVTFCLVLLLFTAVHASTQVMGNYGTQQQSYQTIQYNPENPLIFSSTEEEDSLQQPSGFFVQPDE